MPTIQGITFPDIITGKTPGADLLHIFSGSGEVISDTYFVRQYNFITHQAIVIPKDPKTGWCLKFGNKFVHKTLIVKDPKYSINGQKPVSID